MDARMRNRIRKRGLRGQAIVEYIIIIAIIAVAALTILGIFSDRIRAMISGAATEFGATNASSEVEKSSKEIVQKMDKDGVPDF